MMPDTEETQDQLPGVPPDSLERLKAGVEFFADQEERERDDLAFQVPENQWEDDAADSRKATEVDGVSVPARPMISIPKLDQPIQLILNQEKAAHLGVNIHPVSEDADDDTAETLQDMYRAIERDSRAYIARSWGFDRAVKAGRGAYRVVTEWDDESGHPLDQKICIKRILDGASVVLDPSAQEPDWSDGEWGFIKTWVAHDVYKRKYPESLVSSVEAGELYEIFGEDAPEWVRLDDDKPAILVVEYFWKEYTKRAWVILEDGKFVYEDEMPEGATLALNKAGKPLGRRTVMETSVKWVKMNSQETLEAEDWNGKYIPIIPVIGKELQPFNGERRWTGLIGPNKGAARMFNYAASGLIETSALEPKAPYQMYAGQETGYETMWQQANVRNFPYMLSNPVQLPGGMPAPLPQRTQVTTSTMGPNMVLLERADNFIQAGTATFEPSLGNAGKERSGKAVMALQQQSDAGNSHYLHNLAEISMTYEAKVVLDMMPRVYDRPGRVARIIDGENNTRAVILNAPFTVNDRGRPSRVDPQQPGPMGTQDEQVLGPQPRQPQKKVREYNLKTGTYGVSVTIGKSYQTRMQQGAETIGTILEHNPGLLPLIGATYFNFRDEPGMAELTRILKKVREKEHPGIDKDDEDGVPPEVAQLQEQMKEMMEAGQAQIQELQQKLDTQGVKAQADVQRDQQKLTAEVEKDRNRLASERLIQEQKIEADERLAQAKIDADERSAALTNIVKLSVAEFTAETSDAHEHAEDIRQTVGMAHEEGMAAQKTADAPPVPAQTSQGDGDSGEGT